MLVVCYRESVWFFPSNSWLRQSQKRSQSASSGLEGSVCSSPQETSSLPTTLPLSCCTPATLASLLILELARATFTQAFVFVSSVWNPSAPGTSWLLLCCLQVFTQISSSQRELFAIATPSIFLPCLPSLVFFPYSTWYTTTHFTFYCLTTPTFCPPPNVNFPRVGVFVWFADSWIPSCWNGAQ